MSFGNFLLTVTQTRESSPISTSTLSHCLCLRSFCSYTPIHQEPYSLPSWLSSSSASPPHLFPVSSCIWKHKLAVLSLAGELPLDDLPYNAKCYCVTEVLHTSCPASQSPSPKLLSRVYPPSGTSVGGSRVGGSIRLGSYWRDWKWLELEIEVLQLQSRRATSCIAEEMWEYKWKILRSFVPNF